MSACGGRPSGPSVDTDAPAVDTDVTWACDTAPVPTVLGTVVAPAVVEASGLVWSGAAQQLFVHNDSGSEGQLFGLSLDGALSSTLDLEGARPRDAEDVAIRRDAGGDTLLLGDIGDNSRSHPSITLRVVPADGAGANTSVTWTYADGAMHDAEALLVDPSDDLAVVVTKDFGGDSLIYAAAGRSQVEVLDLVGALDVSALGGDNLVTGGDVSPDGRWVALRTYLQVVVWHRDPGQSLAEVLGGEPFCAWPVGEPQGESVAFAPAGLVTLSEGSEQPLLAVPWPVAEP